MRDLRVCEGFEGMCGVLRVVGGFEGILGI